MAKLTNGDSNSIAGDDLFAMLASCGVLFCMISALMGIKLWWFKHRLSFDQSRTNNAEAGRATPTAPLRTHRNREKRISQEIQEPVELNGSFRRREENDLDIVPTKQLPPVRIRMSQSTPTLFPQPPPRRADRVRSAIYKEFSPPIRGPPKSPMVSPQPPTSTMSLAEELPTFEEIEKKYRQREMKEESRNQQQDSNESLVRLRDTPPQPPKRLNRHSYNDEKVKTGMNKFMKVRLRSTELTQSLQNVSERRATGYLRTSEENINAGAAGNEAHIKELPPTRSHSVEEFGERRPTGYIKYEEIDVDLLADFRHKWESLHTSFGAPSPISFQSTDHIPYGTLNGHDYDHISQARAAVAHAEKNTYYIGSEENLNLQANEKFASNNTTPVSHAGFNWQASERFASNNHTSVSQTSIDFTSDEEFANELGGFQPKMTPRLASSESFANFTTQSPSITPSSPNAKVAGDTPVVLRPQKIRPEQLWDELEANIKEDEREKRVWHEIEQDFDFNRDFASNIEEEFDRIRHSYEENEAGILENNCNLKRIHKQILISLPEPEGFGKNIDEDWANFENLAKNQPQPIPLVDDEKPVLQFNLSDLEDAYDYEPTLREEQQPVGIVRNSRQFVRELSIIEDVDEPTTPIHTGKEELSFDTKDTSVKQSEVTDSGSLAVADLKEEYVHEHNKTSIFEPAPEPLTVEIISRARPRPRQKVTFDFTSTEYIQNSGEGKDKDEEDQSAHINLLLAIENEGWFKDLTEGVESTRTTQALPTPMQRITKIHHTTTESNESTDNTTEDEVSTIPSSTSTSPARVQLFSLEESHTEMNNSWTTIFQQREISTLSTSTSTSSIPLTYMSLRESPTLAHSSPIPEQKAIDPRVILTEVQVMEQHYVSNIKPQPAARKQYFEQSVYNVKEA